MRLDDTIVARSSPPGRSARALIRLSGPASHRALDALLSPHGVGSSISLGQGPRLPVRAVRFHAPRSATGENVAEILLPGNPALVERVIDALIAAAPETLRRAEAGEFTARAFMAGRLDLVQAEGIARMIAARSEAQRHTAARLLSGQTGRRFAEWSDRIAELLALTEAGIDFTDQDDVVAIAPSVLAERIAAMRVEMNELLRQSAPAEHREARPRAVLVGVPNAGKSTLFNALLGRERAVVSDVAGSTRDVLGERLDLSADVPGAGEIDLVDLAGLDLGDADLSTAGGRPGPDPPAGGHESGASAARRSALAAIASADVLVLCDPRGRFEELMAALPEPARSTPTLRVRTKADLPAPHRLDTGSPLVEHAGPPPPSTAVPVCALDRWNLPVLRRALADLIAASDPGTCESDVLPRHRAAIAQTHAAIVVAASLVDPAAPAPARPELIAAALRRALDGIGQITGATAPDEILGRIFATFCVGK